ncbi:MAG TPA: acetolactate decarboxylase [Methanoregulaceae archaeon]|nr:acetolactate decarboxylase [Methanoregulaceae archaeon]
MPMDQKLPEEKNSMFYGNGGRLASHIIAIAVALIIILVIAGGVIINDAVKSQAPGLSNITNDNADDLYQVSTIDALSSSLYDGVTSVGEIQQHGDFGSGTFEGLDGELIALDGTVYQARSDGTVRKADPAMKIPFAMVKFFRQDTLFDIPGGKNLSDTEQDLNRHLPSENLIYAIKARGTFPDITVRAIPKQEKPYPLLVDAVAQESILHLKNSTGTLVGFYFPSSFSGVNVPGYHFHYISDDRTKGGHVLDFTGAEPALTISADQVSEITISIPTTGDFISANLSKGSASGSIISIETKSR